MYEPSSSSDSSNSFTSDTENVTHISNSSLGERKFIVAESKLMQLFSVCHSCGGTSHGQIKQTVGTMVKIEKVCEFCGMTQIWNSQSLVGAVPSGNLAMSAGILFAGGNCSKLLRIFNFMNVVHISKETFMLHQKHYLFPAIDHCWREHQRKYLDSAREKGDALVLGGDGRADTPGHCAKFGSYSMIDLVDGVVIAVQLVQSNEVKGSVNMEKEGLIRCMRWLNNQGLDVGVLVTDRHLQIQKWVRENMATSKHFYNVWHVAKGLKKKLVGLAKIVKRFLVGYKLRDANSTSGRFWYGSGLGRPLNPQRRRRAWTCWFPCLAGGFSPSCAKNVTTSIFVS